MKTYSQKPADVKRQWFLIDASQASFGRVATVAASLLIGKGKPTFTSHVDGGDYVVIINTDEMVATGAKQIKKIYWRHSGFPGGIYKRTLDQQKAKDSTKIIRQAVRGMLPVNKLRAGRLERLKIYTGAEHAHMPQKPTELSLKGDK
ncbi:MAG TPA: 50S ribosomal protein L13 [Candidatus Saccharimonadales bacterium]|nr:50S ribosomal protein L13 [Candidatus Saccharimonadales bacterium]